jgi:hypothetical protein
MTNMTAEHDHPSLCTNEPATGRLLTMAFGYVNDEPTAALFVGDSDEPVLLPAGYIAMAIAEGWNQDDNHGPDEDHEHGPLCDFHSQAANEDLAYLSGFFAEDIDAAFGVEFCKHTLSEVAAGNAHVDDVEMAAHRMADLAASTFGRITSGPIDSRLPRIDELLGPDNPFRAHANIVSLYAMFLGFLDDAERLGLHDAE